MVGTKLGPYEIRDEIGAGGMATVYRAYHPPTDRVVAVKVIRASFADDPETVARFQREARIIAKLEHPHLLPVYDFDATHSPPYIVMRYLAGGTLKDRLRRGRLPLEASVHLLAQVASSLDFAHRQGVVHRDIKPSNIMLDDEGNAFLADFGLARIGQPSLPGEGGLTMPGTVLGTPFYMAPEQVIGSESVGSAADLYALGVLLFELATGRLPFEDENPMAVAMAHLNRPPPRASALAPHLPQALDVVLLKSLAKVPSDRFVSAVEFAHAASHAAGLTDAGMAPPPAHAEAAPTLTPERRAAADSKATPSEQRKLVTALSLSVAQLAETLADEETDSEQGPLERLWAMLERVVQKHGGATESRTAESALVLWGVEMAQEDDVRRAVLCALDLRLAVADFIGAGVVEQAPLQVGITTGLVHLHKDHASGRISSSGGSLLLASRLARSAPPGAILLSKETRHHIRDAFDLTPAAPLKMPEGKAPVETFAVSGVCGPDGGVAREGTVFRRREIESLQASFLAVGREGRCRAVTVVAEPGLGKSRLISEFDRWLGRERLPYRRMAARAEAESSRQPYGLLRAALSDHFGLQAREGVDAARGKLAVAFGGGKGPADNAVAESLAFLSSWLGAETAGAAMSTTAAVGSARFRETLAHALGTYLSCASRKAVVVIEISDLHWADEGSLQALESMVQHAARLPVFALFFTRPDLFQAAPSWGTGLPRHTRLDLGPLTREESESFVADLLRALPEIPRALSDLLVERSEGNPLYIEELVQVLIDDGVLLPGPGEWAVDMGRLTALRVPSTLTGLIQARLEGLTTEERTALQRAAVVGRQFWTEAVQELSGADSGEFDAQEALDGLIRRGLLSVSDGGAMSFASNLLRDVVLESIPKKLRRSYSALAAAWLSARFGSRSARMATTIGELFVCAGASEDAARAFCRAGEQALEVSAFEDARDLFQRALSLLGAGGAAPLEISVRIHLSEALVRMGAYREADTHLGVALEQAFSSGDTRAQADALYLLAQVALGGGDLLTAGRLFTESLDAAGVEDRWAQSRALLGLGEVAWRTGAYEEAESRLQTALLLSREMGDTAQALDCLNRLGALALSAGDLEQAHGYLEECHREALDSGCRDRLAAALDGLGEVLLRQGDAATALAHFQDALALSEALGFHLEAVNARTDMAYAHLSLGERQLARPHFIQALKDARSQGATESMLRAALGLAIMTGGETGQTLAGELLRHPAAGASVRQWAGLFGDLPAAQAEAGPPPALDAIAASLLSPQSHLMDFS